MCDCGKDKKEFLEQLLSDLWKAYELFKDQKDDDTYTRTLVLEACSMLSKTFLKTEEETMMTDELKSCPFCGEPAYFIKQYNTGDSPKDYYTIGCKQNKDCWFYFGDEGISVVEELCNDIASMWNTRPVSDCILNGNATQEMLDSAHAQRR
jgi:hypothetical protein